MNSKDLLANIEKLCSFPSVSGNEREAVLWVKEQLRRFADRCWVDAVGNLIAVKGKPDFAIFSHIDKFGFMVSSVFKDKVSAVVLKPKKRFEEFPKGKLFDVLIGDKKIKGTLYGKSSGVRDLIIKVSAKDVSTIQVGDFVAVSPNFEFNDGVITSQALDNSIGVACGIEMFKKAKNVAFVASVQEELTHMGARIAARTLKPKAAIVLDVTYDETPYGEVSVEIGKGPSVCLKDSLLPDKALVNLLVNIAGHKSIPLQLEAIESGGSDALGFYDLYKGIPFVFVGIPTQFIHTHKERASFKDIVYAAKLVSAFLKEVDGGERRTPTS